MGISGAGKLAEQAFARATGARLSAKRSPDGRDATIVVDGKEYGVEIKVADGGTANQVRAIRYLTLAVRDTAAGCWYVVPACDVVELAACYKAQHVRVSFECCTLSRTPLSQYRCLENDLQRDIVAAIAQAEQRPDLKEMMQQLARRLDGLARETVACVSQISTRCMGSDVPVQQPDDE